MWSTQARLDTTSTCWSIAMGRDDRERDGHLFSSRRTAPEKALSRARVISRLSLVGTTSGFGSAGSFLPYEETGELLRPISAHKTGVPLSLARLSSTILPTTSSVLTLYNTKHGGSSFCPGRVPIFAHYFADAAEGLCRHVRADWRHVSAPGLRQEVPRHGTGTSCAVRKIWQCPCCAAHRAGLGPLVP